RKAASGMIARNVDGKRLRGATMAQKTISPSIAIQIAAKRVLNRKRREAGADCAPGSAASVFARMLMAPSPLRRGHRTRPGYWPTGGGWAAAGSRARGQTAKTPRTPGCGRGYKPQAARGCGQ